MLHRNLLGQQLNQHGQQRKPTDAAAPKKETIVVDKPVTKEDVEKLGKELDKLNEAENKQQPNDNTTAAN